MRKPETFLALDGVPGTSPERFRIGHLPIDPLTFEQALAAIAALVEARAGGTVFTPNVDHVVLAEDDARFRTAYAEASLSLVDGVPVLAAARLLGHAVPEKVSGSDLLLPLAARAAHAGYSLYLVGAGPGVGEAAARRLQQLYPGLVVRGTDASLVDMDGPAEARAPVLRRAREARADLVLVALGSPKGELWAAEARPALAPSVLVAIGAGLDFLVGTQKRAPRIVSRIGLEWLYRLVHEPRRLWRRYVVRGPRFLPIALRSERRAAGL